MEKFPISREGIEQSQNTHVERKEIPAGWLAIGTLAKDIGRTHKVVARIVEKYRDEHPEWFSTSHAED